MTEQTTATGLLALATAFGSKDLLLKVFGPTCEYMGQGLRDFTQLRFNQFKKILERAAELSSGDAHGAIPWRVIRDVIDNGTIRDDRLSAAYFGGILATSRSGISHDDRGSHHLATIERLSYFQLRAHWLIYSTIARLMKNQNLTNMPSIQICKVAWMSAMRDGDNLEPDTFVQHSLQPLNREHLMLSWSDQNNQQLKITPFFPGAELFLWANGVKSTQVSHLASLDLEQTVAMPSLSLENVKVVGA